MRLIFLPSGVWGAKVKEIEPEVRYRAFLFNPVDGGKIDLGGVEPDSERSWRPPLARPPVFQDWVLVLER